MGNFYLDIETTGLNPNIDEIITIQFQELNMDGTVKGRLAILKAWESSEKDILNTFIRTSGINDKYPFAFVCVGYNLGFEHNFLRLRAEIHKLPIVDILNKPFIDLRAVGIIMNNGNFKGSGLDKITGKASDGSQVPIWYKDKEYDKIIAYIENEAEEFIKFNSWLYGKLPPLLEEYKKEIKK